MSLLKRLWSKPEVISELRTVKKEIAQELKACNVRLQYENKRKSKIYCKA